MGIVIFSSHGMILAKMVQFFVDVHGLKPRQDFVATCSSSYTANEDGLEYLLLYKALH
jgi:hypothetical protein